MPPSAPPPAEDTAVIEKWVAAGMPKTGCATSTGTLPTTPSPFDTATTCTSNARWILGDNGKALMHPGGACNACHRKKGERTIYTAAGTIYPTAHEPDECIGVRSAASVLVTDANGRQVTLPVNASGNFVYTSPIAKPFKVAVAAGGKTRAMSAPVDDGDCNACHTEKGDKKAPGRIMLP